MPESAGLRNALRHKELRRARTGNAFLQLIDAQGVAISVFQKIPQRRYEKFMIFFSLRCRGLRKNASP